MKALRCANQGRRESCDTGYDRTVVRPATEVHRVIWRERCPARERGEPALHAIERSILQMVGV